MRYANRLIGSGCMLALLACFTAHAGTLQSVLNSGELRVGYTLAPPWALRDQDGELEGFEIAVARKLAADMGVEPQFRRYDYDQLIRALEAGEIDIVAAGLTITPERALHVNFSQPYSTGGIGIATNLETTADVERLEDLDTPAFRIAVIADSVAESLAERIVPRARIVRFYDENEAADALVSGDVDVYLEEDPIPSFLALEHPRSVDVPVDRPLLETRSAFAVIKGDPDFLAYLNAWIEAREADTWLPTTYQYWFRTLQWRD